ncbi:hypothetical protein AB1Y20_006021 [Prymnesium parvum]|uniref:Separase n=1 Tax=Prymnesium parvum TaxID=97485 RepID=A0AB34J4J6_PRYPA
MRFIDINEQEHGPTPETAHAISIEAHEAANQARYERALQLQSDGSAGEAAKEYRKLLDDPLVADARPTDHAQDVEVELTARPSLLIRSLALKNLALIESEAGDHEQALTRLLLAVQLQQKDGVLWHRLGSLALRSGKSHLARYALEQATRCSPHLQLGQRSLAQLLSSINDAAALEYLHVSTRRMLPHMSNACSAIRRRQLTGPENIIKAVPSSVKGYWENVELHHPLGRNTPHEVTVNDVSWAAIAEALCRTWFEFKRTHADSACLFLGQRVRLRLSSHVDRNSSPQVSLSGEAHSNICVQAEVREPPAVDGEKGDEFGLNSLLSSANPSHVDSAKGNGAGAREAPVEYDSATPAGPVEGSLDLGQRDVSPTAMPSPTSVELTDYEEKRLANMAQNKRVLQELGLVSSVDEESKRTKTATMQRKQLPAASRTQPKRKNRGKALETFDPSASERERRAPAPPPSARLRTDLCQLLAYFIPPSVRGIPACEKVVCAAEAADDLACQAAARVKSAEGSGPTDRAADGQEPLAVRAWLDSTAVEGNSGLLHLSSLLLERLLGARADGTGCCVDDGDAAEAEGPKRRRIEGARLKRVSWCYAAMPFDERRRLGLSLLKLEDALLAVVAEDGAPARGRAVVEGVFTGDENPCPSPLFVRDFQLAPEVSLGLAELRIDLVKDLGKLSSQSSGGAPSREYHLGVIEQDLTSVRGSAWRGALGRGCARSPTIHLQLRLSWACARASELCGDVAQALVYLRDCERLLQPSSSEVLPSADTGDGFDALCSTAPVTLPEQLALTALEPPVLTLRTVKAAQHRMTHEDLVRSAKDLLKPIQLRGGACRGAQWRAVLHVHESKAIDIREKCTSAWTVVMAAALATAKAERSLGLKSGDLPTLLQKLVICWLGRCALQVSSSDPASCLAYLSAGDLLQEIDHLLECFAISLQCSLDQLEQWSACPASAPASAPPAAASQSKSSDESAQLDPLCAVNDELVLLMQAVEAFERTARAAAAHQTPARGADQALVSLSLLARSVASMLGAERRQTTAQGADTTLKQALHYTILAFCKVWSMRPRSSADTLLLLDGSWQVINLHEAVRVPSYQLRTAGSKPARKLGPDSPFAQFCLVTALKQLQTQGAELDQLQLPPRTSSNPAGHDTENSLPTITPAEPASTAESETPAEHQPVDGEVEQIRLGPPEGANEERKDDYPSPTKSVRDGWESLLHLACECLYGVHTAVLRGDRSVSSRELEESDQPERITHPLEAKLLFDYLWYHILHYVRSAEGCQPKPRRDDSLKKWRLEMRRQLDRLLPPQVYPMEPEHSRTLLEPSQCFDGAATSAPPELKSFLADIPKEIGVCTTLSMESCTAGSSTPKRPSPAEPHLCAEPQTGGRLCAALAHFECATAEATWIEELLEPGLRLQAGKLTNSSLEKFVDLARAMRWSASLTAQAVRLLPYERMAHMQLALSLGTLSRKLWHLHVDASIGTGCSRSLPISAGTSSTVEATDAFTHLTSATSARQAATLCVHSLRWVLEHSRPDECTGALPNKMASIPMPDGTDSRIHVTEGAIRLRALEELACFLLTEAGVLSTDASAAVALLRECAHTTQDAAKREILSMLEARAEPRSWYSNMLIGRTKWSLRLDPQGCLEVLGSAVLVAAHHSTTSQSQALHELAVVQSDLLESTSLALADGLPKDTFCVGELTARDVLFLLEEKGVGAVMRQINRAVQSEAAEEETYELEDEALLLQKRQCALVDETLRALNECLAAPGAAWQHRSRLLRVHLLWKLAGKPADALAEVSQLFQGKKRLMWNMFLYSIPSSDDCFNGLSLRTHELHDDCTRTARLYIDLLFECGRELPEFSRSLDQLHTAAGFLKDEQMVCEQQLALQCFVKCLVGSFRAMKQALKAEHSETEYSSTKIAAGVRGRSEAELDLRAGTRDLLRHSFEIHQDSELRREFGCLQENELPHGVRTADELIHTVFCVYHNVHFEPSNVDTPAVAIPMACNSSAGDSQPAHEDNASESSQLQIAAPVIPEVNNEQLNVHNDAPANTDLVPQFCGQAIGEKLTCAAGQSEASNPHEGATDVGASSMAIEEATSLVELSRPQGKSQRPLASVGQRTEAAAHRLPSSLHVPVSVKPLQTTPPAVLPDKGCSTAELVQFCVDTFSSQKKKSYSMRMSSEISGKRQKRVENTASSTSSFSGSSTIPSCGASTMPS